ncbi:hypothetical protein HYS91_01310 [Candidatus Daviesbacteria bacterium]|nr:hypothetical protein [Candidatus Daviesbacteria bacterium]
MAVANFLSPQKIIETKTVEVLKNPQTWQKQATQEVREDFSELDKLRFKDIDWRLKNRENFRKFLMGLLIFQNVAVFLIVGLAVWFDKVKGLELIFATLIGGTLLETAGLILIIIKWLFSEISYKGKNF